MEAVKIIIRYRLTNEEYGYPGSKTEVDFPVSIHEGKVLKEIKSYFELG